MGRRSRLPAEIRRATPRQARPCHACGAWPRTAKPSPAAPCLRCLRCVVTSCRVEPRQTMPAVPGTAQTGEALPSSACRELPRLTWFRCVLGGLRCRFGSRPVSPRRPCPDLPRQRCLVPPRSAWPRRAVPCLRSRVERCDACEVGSCHVGPRHACVALNLRGSRNLALPALSCLARSRLAVPSLR